MANIPGTRRNRWVDEGCMDRAEGQMKEAAGALTGDKDTNAEGRADQRRGKFKEKKGNLKDLLK